jgi:hypothetical protein
MIGRHKQVPRPIAANLPPVVVREKVMMSAQQDSVGDIGASAVALPVVDVVCFAPGWWPFATGPAASAIACGKGDALGPAEESAFAAQVEWLASVLGRAVDRQHNRARTARHSFDRGDRDGV